MKLTIHRGTKEIGGSCVEISTQTTRVIVDVGLPLVDQDREPFDRKSMKGKSLDQLVADKVIPPVPGLFVADQQAREPDAILLSHAHLDHVGLLEHTPENVPVYATAGTSKMMLAGSVFAGQQSLSRVRHREVLYEQPIQIGDMKVVAYPVDHSCYGAVAFLFEADGKRLLYSGDLRWHGRKPGMIRSLVENVAPLNIDALVMEGTHFGSKRPPRKTEYDLEKEITQHIKSAPGLVLASFSPIDVDRLVTYFKASVQSGRTFVADAYTAFVMYLVHKEINNFPDPRIADRMKVFFNESFRRRKIAKIESLFANNQIQLTEILADQSSHVLCFRPSNLRLDFDDQLPEQSRVLYSYWHGYLQKSDWQRVQTHVSDRNGDFVSAHTSGHIYPRDIDEFVARIAAKIIVPIHTFNASVFADRFRDTVLLTDQEQFDF